MEPDVIYHYTSFSAFRSIVETRSLWATHLRYLNDSLEASHAFSLAGIYIDDQLAGFTGLGAKLTETFSRGPLTACAVSFSEEADSLSQWRAYSREGAGVCIGFKAGLFDRLIRSHQPSSEQLLRCIYEENEKQQAIQAILQKPLSRFVETQAQSDKETLAQLLSDIVIPIVLNAPRLKHNAFKDEKEWRFVRHAAEKDGVGLKATPWQFRACDSYLIPYTTINLCELEPLDLEEVVIGPNPHGADAVRSTEVFLATAGVKCRTVRSSRAPFRYW